MMDDLISRQAAIDALLGEVRLVDGYYVEMPERMRGKWLLLVGYGCSCCNYKLQTTGIPSYCPNCGADMRGET